MKIHKKELEMLNTLVENGTSIIDIAQRWAFFEQLSNQHTYFINCKSGVLSLRKDCELFLDGRAARHPV